MLPKEAYDEAHLIFPLKKHYKFKQDECKHNFDWIVYEDDNEDIEIVRCYKCGKEKEVHIKRTPKDNDEKVIIRIKKIKKQ